MTGNNQNKGWNIFSRFNTEHTGRKLVCFPWSCAVCRGGSGHVSSGVVLFVGFTCNNLDNEGWNVKGAYSVSRIICFVFVCLLFDSDVISSYCN